MDSKILKHENCEYDHSGEHSSVGSCKCGCDLYSTEKSEQERPFSLEKKSVLSQKKNEQEIIEEIYKESYKEYMLSIYVKLPNFIPNPDQFERTILSKALQKGKEIGILTAASQTPKSLAKGMRDDSETKSQCNKCGVYCEKSQLRIKSCDGHFNDVGSKRTMCYRVQCSICPDCFYGYDKIQASKIAELEKERDEWKKGNQDCQKECQEYKETLTRLSEKLAKVQQERDEYKHDAELARKEIKR